MKRFKNFDRSTVRWLIGLACLKLLLHFFTNYNYGFHRDEFLYLDEGNHLGWGFFEVPPFTPFIGWLTTSLFGDGIFAVRLFPALAGAVVVFLIGLMVKEMGGKKWAIILACLAFILSPSFLRTNTLFQPVCFNQMWWAVAAFLLIKVAKKGHKKYWYWLGITVGLGWLTKYSIGFFMLAMLLGVLATNKRKWLATVHPWAAIGIAFLVALPNLLWQYHFNFPVVHHMSDLAATQLVNVSTGGFLFSQFRMQFASSLIWLPGLVWLFVSRNSKQFRFLAWGYVFLIAMLLFLSGKSYYTLGAYPMLMAAGGVAIEGFLEKKSNMLKYAFLVILILPNLFLLPIGLPLLPVEKLKSYSSTLANYGYVQKWEDGKTYALPQDYADMHGWEEMAATVAKKYHSLPEESRENCLIWGGGYSHASSLNYYRDKFELPEIFSLNSSYKLWAQVPAHFDNLILVDDVWSDSSSFFYHHEFVDSIRNPYAREKGYVFYRQNPRINIDSAMVEIIKKERAGIGK